MAQVLQPPLSEVGTLINLIPVGLKEAALDSPTSRATVIHFSEQIDHLEKWLEDYLKGASRLITEATTLEIIVTNFTALATLPGNISESILDHDYSLLAMRKYSDGAKDYWMSLITVMRRLNIVVVEPIRAFLQNEIRAFKDTRRTLETTQKIFDNLQSKFASLGKMKEPSSLREDAFQMHEARKAYLKASMEFFTVAPQLRFSVDKLIVRIFFDQWKELRTSRENSAATFERGAQEMERVKGWIREMESNEKAFRKELVAARKQLEDAAESSQRPSRELEDYAAFTVPPHLGGPSAPGTTLPRSPKKTIVKSGEKQGWLYLRTYAGKPARAVWVKRWAFVKNGIFGWLVQGAKAGGVEESERIGVLLCNARPAPTEERRFCFEVKTNKNTIVLQAETQGILAEWLAAFETAKAKALDNPGNTFPGLRTSDPAFAITPPPIPEFGTIVLSSLEPGAGEDTTALERAGTMPVSGGENSKDPIDIARRATGLDEGSSSRIISKLDLVRKSQGSTSVSGSPVVGGGIASLIAASHGSMPVGPSVPWMLTPESEPIKRSTFKLALRDMPPSSLAPSVLTNPPAPTNMSKAAIVVVGERGAATDKNGISNGILANTWGSSSLSYVNRLERGELKLPQDGKLSNHPSPLTLPTGSPSKGAVPSLKEIQDSSVMSTLDLSLPRDAPATPLSTSPEKRHRNTISVDADAAKQVRNALTQSELPSSYPLQLKTQDAQFRLLFPSVRREERLLLVFRATWNPNDQQEFPGRAYVTTKEIYFYSNHLGLVLTSGVLLSTIDEVTAAPGRECDFLFLHLKEAKDDGSPTRITIKTFLEPLRLLQRRLNYLVRNSVAEPPQKLEDVIRVLLRMESEQPERSPSLESWEDVSPDTPVDGGHVKHRSRASTVTDFKAPVRVDRAFGTLNHQGLSPAGAKIQKFKLPAQPVIYTPSGNLRRVVEQQFDVSPKALFHVLFGDKSAVWQLLQHERRAQNLRQGPWINMGEGRLRREIDFDMPTRNTHGGQKMIQVKDYQVVDVNNDHLCYVVTDKRTPWHLPFAQQFRLISKVVITHLAKGKCKLAIFVKVDWRQNPLILKNAIEQHAINDLELDALDLADLVSDQVRRLGAMSRTKKAIQIFGQVGQSTETTQMQIDTSTMNIEMRRLPVVKTAFDLMLQGAGTAAESALATMLEGGFKFLRWIWKTCTAHSVILVLLTLSALYNGWTSTRDGREWWHERNAAKFMSRIGVSPNHVMSKAVYISDLDTVLAKHGALPDRESNACYSVFHDVHQLDDLDAPILHSDNHSKDSALQIQKARQKLGVYRHDLLVAMRVVNSIEKEVIRSEWEQWLTSENRRCRQVGALLERTANGTSTAVEERQLGGKEEEEKVKSWYDDFCVSCLQEHGSRSELVL